MSDLGRALSLEREAAPLEARRRSFPLVALRNTASFFHSRPLAAAGTLSILLVVFLAVFSKAVTPYDPLRTDVDVRLIRPNHAHLLGTDDLGRDVFSRLIAGSRAAVEVGILTVSVTMLLGSIVGIISGYAGGAVDFVIQRLVDGLQGIPGLILAMALIAALGNSLVNVMLAISVALSPGLSRVVRSALLAEKQALYVDAAVTIGASHLRIVLRHLLPALLPVIVVLATSIAGVAILVEASLSFLGLGTPPPAPSWGGMLGGEALSYVRQAPWLSIAPGVAISLLVLSLNILGDAVRDAIDPVVRLRQTRLREA